MRERRPPTPETPGSGALVSTGIRGWPPGRLDRLAGAAPAGDKAGGGCSRQADYRVVPGRCQRTRDRSATGSLEAIVRSLPGGRDLRVRLSGRVLPGED